MKNRATCLIAFCCGVFSLGAQPEDGTRRPANADEDRLYADAREVADLARIGKPPQVVRQAAPDYPFEMRRAGLQGEVLVGFIVDTEGNVREAHVLQSNNIWFERPALDAVLKWKFRPGQVEGRPVNSRMRVPMIFNLDGGGDELWSISKKGHDKLPEELRWDRPPRVIGTAYPVYPFPALKEGAKGKVQCTFLISRQGFVDDVFFHGEPRPDFRQSVRAALDNWRFEPARKSDQPSPAAISMEFDFQPDGHGEVPVPSAAADILKRLKNPKAQFATAGELDRPLRPMSRRPPAYPVLLRAAGTEGEAVIEFFIDEKGDAHLPHIVSSTHEEFGYAAAQSVASWRFAAPKKGGKPVTVRVKVPVTFSLKEQKPGPGG